MKIQEMAKCPSCKRKPKLCQWTDTLEPNATWIECKCGIMTRTFHTKDAELAKRRALEMWNQRSKRKFINPRAKKDKILSCPCCPSKKIKKKKFDHRQNVTYFLVCDDCGLMTDEMTEKGKLITTLAGALKIWNGKK